MTHLTAEEAAAPARAARPVTPLGILERELRELLDMLDHGAGDQRLRARLDAAWRLCAGLDPYVERHTTPPSPTLRTLADRTAARDWTQHDGVVPVEREMLSGHVEGQFLAMLAYAVRARRVLDVGMFTGYSALALAEALPDDGTVVACEIDPALARFARRSFDTSSSGVKVDIRVGPAGQTLSALADAGDRFDLVFVDADKGGYLQYVDTVLDRGLLAPHGLICVDNTLMQGQPWRGDAAHDAGAAIAAFNDAVTADPRVEQVIVPLRDGITLIRPVDVR